MKTQRKALDFFKCHTYIMVKKVQSLHKWHEVKMNASYKKLWKLLIDRDLNKTTLQKMAGISSVSMAKLSKNENVTTDILVNLVA